MPSCRAYREDAAFNIRLTYQVQGAYYAYSENVRRFGVERVLGELESIVRRIYPAAGHDPTTKTPPRPGSSQAGRGCFVRKERGRVTIDIRIAAQECRS